jgi:hypothetical protein
MSCNVLLHDYTRHNRILPLDGSMRPAERPTSAVILAILLKQSMKLRNARWVSMHEVDVRMTLGKRVPLGRLQKLMSRHSSVCFVQPVPNIWNVVIADVRQEQKNFPHRPTNGLTHTIEMWETSNSSSPSFGVVTETPGRSEALEHGIILFT